MTGTIVNAVGIIAGSLLGLLLRRGIPERINAAILKIEGLAIALIGLSSILTTMLSVEEATGKIKDSGGLLLLISLVIGCVCGELLAIDDKINRLGGWIERKSNAEGFAKGFVTASIMFSVGAMSVIGPINDGLTGDAGILYIKTVLDFTTSVVLASTFGVGVLFSFVPVFVMQAIPALFARQISAFLTDALLSGFCMVGYAVIICIGLNFLCDTKIKVANLLPSLLVPIVYRLLF